MNRQEFDKILSDKGINSRTFLDNAWNRLQGFADRLSIKEFSEIVDIFVERSDQDYLTSIRRS